MNIPATIRIPTGWIIVACAFTFSQAAASVKEISIQQFVPSVSGDGHPDHRTGRGHNAVLLQNFPNPFNPVTRITFSLPQRGFVRLDVCTLLGVNVATLVEGEQSSGIHHVVLDGSNLPSGIYFCRLETPQGVLTTRMVLLK